MTLVRRLLLRLAAMALPLIVLAPAAFAVDPVTYMNDGQRGSPHLAMVRALIGGGNYPGAVEALRPILAGNPEDVEALSLMGFSQRKSGNHQAAFGYYSRALALDPEHLGTNEYLGELYVETGELALARERLGVLEDACGTECNAYKDLTAVIAGVQ
jgi:tetratricopeptide (TPR) repeat protein